jgi:hypothetical protein
MIEYREDNNNKKKDENNSEREEEDNTTWKGKQHQAWKRVVVNAKMNNNECEEKGVMSKEENDNPRKEE